MKPPIAPPQHHLEPSDISIQLIRMEAKLDAQLGSVKEQLQELKRDIKPIQEHIQLINTLSRVGGKILLSGSAIAVCVRYLMSLF